MSKLTQHECEVLLAGTKGVKYPSYAKLIETLAPVFDLLCFSDKAKSAIQQMSTYTGPVRVAVVGIDMEGEYDVVVGAYCVPNEAGDEEIEIVAAYESKMERYTHTFSHSTGIGMFTHGSEELDCDFVLHYRAFD